MPKKNIAWFYFLFSGTFTLLSWYSCIRRAIGWTQCAPEYTREANTTLIFYSFSLSLFLFCRPIDDGYLCIWLLFCHPFSKRKCKSAQRKLISFSQIKQIFGFFHENHGLCLPAGNSNTVCWLLWFSFHSFVVRIEIKCDCIWRNREREKRERAKLLTFAKFQWQ